jgi:hypothetical protein
LLRKAMPWHRKPCRSVTFWRRTAIWCHLCVKGLQLNRIRPNIDNDGILLSSCN